MLIPNDIYNEMVIYAKDHLPIEACGILAGRDGRVEKFYPLTNCDKSNEHFSMDPAEQFEVVRDIRKNELEMMSIYHSHPETPARLSEEDIRLALTPDVVYTVLSLQLELPVLKGFRLEGEEIIETEITIEQDNK